MDEDQCSQIFNPFYSTKREGEGSGLGLSVSYGLIRRYGGDITVESQPAVGSRFTLWLHREPEMIEDVDTVAEQLHAISAAKHPPRERVGDRAHG
jgi:two-component system NtrC family sensor kinase